MSLRINKPLTIGFLANAAGVGVETIRFYERKGLIKQPRKPHRGFRSYAPEVVECIRFIREAQELGFTLKEITELLALHADPRTDCADVRERAQTKLLDVAAKAQRLEAIHNALKTLIAACPGKGSTVSCSILDALNGRGPAPPSDSRTVRIQSRLRARKAAMKTIVLTISGMHCTGCAETITSLLNLEDGVATATVSFEKGTAQILFDPATTDSSRLAKVIERAGYSVVPSTP